MAVSVGALPSRSIGSVTRADHEFTDLEVQDILQIVTDLHVNIKPPESVATAQLEALHLIARGYRQKALDIKKCIEGGAYRSAP